MSEENGGPAFPCQDGVICVSDGMTLRDYFAAKAMQVYLGQNKSRTAPPIDYAEASYDMADAMLKAREEK